MKQNIILIIDDNATNIRVLVDTLKAHSFETVTARNGIMGIKRAQFSKPDLILLDIKMPNMDGYEVCEHLKSIEQTRDIPVIFISALIESLDKVRAFSVGGVDYVVKPFEEQEILARIENHLQLRELQKTLKDKNRQLVELQHETLFQLNQAYGYFVPRQFLSLLGKKSITDIKLGDQTEQNMTILFADIREFTTLSETMTPQENFNFINAFLSQMEPIITNNNGFIDKYIGDAIMALFYNADDAVQAGIDMLEALKNYNTTRGRPGRPVIKIGIGINTGLLILGIIGSKNRMAGTVISDAVNIASRLESLTKVYHTPLLISESSYQNLTKTDYIRLIDNVKVKGKSEYVKVFEVFVIDSKTIRASKSTTTKQFEQAVHLYHDQNFAEAQHIFLSFRDDATAAVYNQRCQKFLNIDTNTNWGKIAAVIKWTPKLSVGHDLIDQQHKELIIKIKDLIMSLGNEDREDEVGQIIEFLKEYVIIHFDTEEQLMQEHNYSGYLAHKIQHTCFIQRFAKFEKDYKANGGRLYLTLQIQEELVKWLLNHISGTDKKLGIFLKKLDCSNS
ncbi:MAG: bacteriohemerythrin [Proteobacteria bacterium]|nr:bacteriohemerythrin [Pseudomonadota bacterium]